jgi:hypothetical protein
MQSIIERISQLVYEYKPKLLTLLPEEAHRKSSPDAWSRQEILGHLIDSAYNNHQRVIRAMLDQAADFPPYQQEEWVKLSAYNQRDWYTLVDFWMQVNIHLIKVMENVPEDALQNPCGIGKAEPVPLKFVMEDYLRHLNMHLQDILGED